MLISVQPQSNLFYIILGAHPGADAASIEPFLNENENSATIKTDKQKAAIIVITGKENMLFG